MIKTKNMTLTRDIAVDILCNQCGVSDPEINGKLDGHYDHCRWRKSKELELQNIQPDDIETWTMDGIHQLPLECQCKNGKRYKISTVFFA